MNKRDKNNKNELKNTELERLKREPIVPDPSEEIELDPDDLTALDRKTEEAHAAAPTEEVRHDSKKSAPDQQVPTKSSKKSSSNSYHPRAQHQTPSHIKPMSSPVHPTVNRHSGFSGGRGHK